MVDGLSSERDCSIRRRRTAAAWIVAMASSKRETLSSFAFSNQGVTTESFGRKRFLRDDRKNNMNWHRIDRSRRWYIESEPCFLVNSPIAPEIEKRLDIFTENNELSSTMPSEFERFEDSYLVTNESNFLKSPSSQQLLTDFRDRPLSQNKKLIELEMSTKSSPSLTTPVLEKPKVVIKGKSTAKSGKKSSMPPWLWTFSTKSFNSPNIKLFSIPNIPIPTTIELQLSMNALKENMAERSHMSEQEIDAVIKSMKMAVRTCNSPSAVTLSGLIQFVSILVECMEFGTDALIAGVFHYCSCIKAREQEILASDATDKRYIDFESRYLQPLAGAGLEQFGLTAVQIALDAGRLKGTEMMASSILKSYKANTGVLKIQDGKNLKSLLLTVNAGLDWRALGLRCAACLYRLRGLESFRKIAATSNSNRLFDKRLPPIMLDEISVAREALHIYAPLAHQLGTYRLKCELEGAAFQVLYRRQYSALSALLRGRHDNSTQQHKRGIPIALSPFYFADVKSYRVHYDSIDFGMKSIMDDLSSRIKRLLQEDETMMEHISDMKVTARIKEPYSLWRKMLEIHKRNITEFKIYPGRTLPTLSILQVPDAVALRIILKVRKLTKDESDKDTSERERLLCYYAQDLCMKNLPSSNIHTRMKDYILRPKTNGYQSLHYSSKMRWHGEEYPYEVQIRSADMHRVAEYGVASHWSYKESSIRYRTEYRASSSVSDTYLRSIQKARVTKNQVAEDPLLGSRGPMSTDDNLSGGKDDGYLSLVFDPVSVRRNQRDDDRSNKLNQALRIERLRARAESLAPYIEALSTTRMDLAREQVFVFCNHPVYDEESSTDENSSIGSIITLRAGARVIDALREEERLSGLNLGSFSSKSQSSGSRRIDSESIVLRNGVLTSLTQPLESGDVVTVCRPSARADGSEVY